MKKLAVCIVICMIAAYVIAAESENVQRQAVPEPNLQQPRPALPVSPMRNQSRNREQMYLQMQARRAETHAKGIAELDAIRKIAEEEGAVKTVEAIKALIAKKNTEFKEAQAQLEKQRIQRAQQIQRRVQQESVERPKPVNQNNDAPGNPDTDKNDK